MTLVERRIFRINDFVDNINPAQICVEPMEDPDLDFRMYCGTDILGNITKWLAKDQKARITDLSITDRLNMNTNDVVNVGALYAPWTDLDNDVWARLRFYYNGAYPTSEFVQARPNLECGVRLDATRSKVDFFCDTNRGLFFNGPEMALKDYDADTSKYNFLLTSDSSGTVIDSEIEMTLGSAGSLFFSDANILACEDWDTNKVLLSESEEEVQNCFDKFGVKSLFGAILEAKKTTLQEAYNNGGSVVTSSGPTYWVWPVGGGNGSPFSIANNDTDNESAVLQIANESVNSKKYGILFSGASGDASSSGALGHRLWTDDSISIGRTNSASYSSYCVANAANISDTVVATRAQLYAEGSDDFSNDVEAYISVIAGKQGSDGSRSRFSTIYGYSETGQAIWESGLGGKLTLGNSAILGSTASTLSFYDAYRATSDYTGTSVPLAKSIAEWSAFAAIAGVEGSILGGIAASKLGPAISAGQVAYGTGISVAGKSTFVFDPSGGDTLSIGGLSASTRLSLAGTTAAGGSLSSRVYSTTADTAAGLAFSRSRHATLGTHGAVTTADVLGNLLSYGSDGSTFVLGSQISTVASGAGAWSTAGNQAADMVFSTINADTFAERMRLTSAGYLGLGNAAPAARVHCVGTSLLDARLRADCYSASQSDYSSLSLSRSSGAAGFNAVQNNDIIGRLRFIASRTTAWVEAGYIDCLSTGDWTTTAGRTAKFSVFLRLNNSIAKRLEITSMGAILSGVRATADWDGGYFMGYQNLDGSTNGSSQSIVAMTLGLRTTSTTENQVLKLIPSDSGSPLTLQAGYFYSLLVNISATFESGDKKGYVNNTYALTVFYNEVRDKALINSNTTTEYSNILPGTFNFQVTSGVLEIWFTPSAFCSVDNPINVLATIYGGTKIKTGQSQIC